jgi:hypothetical protein
MVPEKVSQTAFQAPFLPPNEGGQTSRAASLPPAPLAAPQMGEPKNIRWKTLLCVMWGACNS